jgi:hypothetical protein
MIYSMIWLGTLTAANGFGWLLAGRTEAATLFMGFAMMALAWLELLATPAGRGLRRTPAAILATGAGLVLAAAFDILNISRSTPQADWLTGFATGALLCGAALLPALRDEWVVARNIKPGGVVHPYWDAVWLSLTLMALSLTYQAIEEWHAGQGASIDDGNLFMAGAGIGLLVCAFVQWSRFRRLYVSGLVVGALASMAMIIFLGQQIVFHIIDAPVLFCALLGALLVAGGSFPVGWFSGTFSEIGAKLFRLAGTGAMVFLITLNLSGSLLNHTVTQLVAAHGPLAPMSEEMFTRLAERDAYLWHNERHTVRRSGKGGVELHLAERDRFSYAWRSDKPGAHVASRPAEAQPLRDAPGVVLARRDGESRVAHVYSGSPAEKAGITRGSLAISKLRPDGFGTQMSFVVPGKGGEVSVGDSAVEKSVDYRVQRAGEGRIGYLFLEGFTQTAIGELNTAFSAFKASKVNELVIDLRYNPGGNLATGEYLASLIAGKTHAGEVMTRLSYNSKYSDRNEVRHFQSLENGLELKRVFVLLSRNSCSASELLVVALRPYLEVVTIGEVSCGKPMGMEGIAFGDLRYRLLNFRVSDARGVGMFHDGLIPDCLVEDNLRWSFRAGSEEDPMFGVAMRSMSGIACKPRRDMPVEQT